MEKIGVVDFGGQYTHLIARRIRQLGVYSEVLSPQSTPETLHPFSGFIFSGGPSSVYAILRKFCGYSIKISFRNVFSLGRFFQASIKFRKKRPIII